MSGESKQTQTQQSVTEPYKEAVPALTDVLGQVQSNLPNTALTSNETGAINSIIDNARTSGQFSPQILDYARSLFAGGGAKDQAGFTQNNFNDFYKNVNGLASNTNYDPRNTPGFSDAIEALKGDITQGINGSFAAAGRDFSGANMQTLGRGLTQGLAPIFQSQYNQNIQNQQGAARDLYNAGNTNAGLLSGMQQQYLTNQGAGIGASGAGLDAMNNPANATLAAEAQRRGIPVQSLGQLANIAVPIGGLGAQSQGTSTGTYTPSTWQQLGQASNAIGGAIGTAGRVAGFISDRNAKEDITQVGALFDGTPVYRYRYIGDPRFQIGLMAQDVEKYAPEAVGQIGPYKAVDYKLATDRAMEAV